MFQNLRRLFAAQKLCLRLSAPYVLIGGGTGSYYTSLTIRARDPDARVLIITDEEETPYKKIPLSKELWWYNDDKTPDGSFYNYPKTGKKKYTHYEGNGFYLKPEELDQWEHGGVALLRGAKVTRVDDKKKLIELEDGQTISFEKCLIATGSKAMFRDEFEAIDKTSKEPQFTVSVLHTLNDYRRLTNFLQNHWEQGNGGRVAILGGGILATELAYSLNRRYGTIANSLTEDTEQPSSSSKALPIEIVQIVPEGTGVLSEILATPLSWHSTDQLRMRGIKVYTNSTIQVADYHRINEHRTQIRLQLKKVDRNLREFGEIDNMKEPEIVCDHLIVALGVEPEVELAKRSGFPLDNKNGGILSDAQLRIKGDIFSAGDICSFIDLSLGMRRRETHWEHAQTTGRIVGENMTGGQKTYEHQSSFVTLAGPEAHISAVGMIDPKRFETVTFMAKEEETTEKTEKPIPAPSSTSDHSSEKEDQDELIDDDDQLSEQELRAVTFYMDPDSRHIVGVLMYNVFGDGLDIARKLITDAQPHPDSQLPEIAKLFEIFELASEKAL